VILHRNDENGLHASTVVSVLFVLAAARLRGETAPRQQGGERQCRHEPLIFRLKHRLSPHQRRLSVPLREDGRSSQRCRVGSVMKRKRFYKEIESDVLAQPARCAKLGGYVF
jgi:hypothetical protein